MEPKLNGRKCLMANEADEKIIRTKIKPKIVEIKKKLDGILDLETKEEVEKLHRELNVLSVDDLLRPFTI